MKNPDGRFARVAALLFLVSVTASCDIAKRIADGPRYPYPAHGGFAGSSNGEYDPAKHPGWSKTVIAQIPPDTLVAEDSTICVVPAKTFEQAANDKKATCRWRYREYAR